MKTESKILPFRRRSEPKRSGRHQTLDRLVEATSHLDAVRKHELSSGDWVVVRTRNSTYTIAVLEDDAYAVSGGWFDQHHGTPTRTTINGCTWGGRAILRDVVATPGLLLEFGNNVTTTRIQDVRVYRDGDPLPEN